MPFPLKKRFVFSTNGPRAIERSAEICCIFWVHRKGLLACDSQIHRFESSRLFRSGTSSSNSSILWNSFLSFLTIMWVFRYQVSSDNWRLDWLLIKVVPRSEYQNQETRFVDGKEMISISIQDALIRWVYAITETVGAEFGIACALSSIWDSLAMSSKYLFSNWRVWKYSKQPPSSWLYSLI